MNNKKVLILGGTGAMGIYLIPELVKMDYTVDVVSLDDVVSDNPKLRYIKANGKDRGYIEELLKNDYNAIVDFLIYGTEEFRQIHKLMLDNTEHYIYLSSYRIYANEEHPIKETSPRLLDVSDNEEFLKSEDYSLYKARGEDILKESGLTNWTAIRPAITFSKFRYQLVTLEANVVITRARAGKTVALPEQALPVQATMSWAGDVAKMISRLILNKAAYTEIYTVSTSEHNTWETIAGYYHELIGLKYVAIDKEEFISILSPENSNHTRWQLEYDRMFDRIVDNSKVLAVTGIKQSELTTVYDGLKRELFALPKDYKFAPNSTNDRMDAYLCR